MPFLLYSIVELPSCHPIPTFKVIIRNQCRSRYHVIRRKCEGTCGKEAGKCCRPVGYRYLRVAAVCKNGGTETFKVCLYLFIAEMLRSELVEIAEN